MEELTEYELKSIKMVSNELTEKLLDLGLYTVVIIDTIVSDLNKYTNTKTMKPINTKIKTYILDDMYGLISLQKNNYSDCDFMKICELFFEIKKRVLK